jgi:hypothetical protein
MVGVVEFPSGSLHDERVRRRANDIMDAMTAKPGLPFTAVFKEPAAALGAYRFVESRRLSFKILTEALAGVYGERVAALEGDTLLCVHDTTELELTRLSSAIGFGTVGNPECRGEFLHSSILVSTQGVFEGFLAAKTWVRPAGERGKAQTRRSRPFEAKESYRWWTQISEAEERVAQRGRLLHVCDREADIFAVLEKASAAGLRLLVRAAQNRRVDEPTRLLWETCSQWPVRATQSCVIPAHRDEPGKPLLRARVAELELRFGEVRVRPARSAARPPKSLPLRAILLRERQPPEGVVPLEWLLLTTDPLPNQKAAWLHVDYYRLRWNIEEFHKCLKTGCKVEARQYEDREHFDVALALAIPVALRLLRLTKWVRVEPDRPAATEFEPFELAVLFGAPTTPSQPTLQQAVLKLAHLGGYLGRRQDGPIGWLRLWRGYARMSSQVEGYLVDREL